MWESNEAAEEIEAIQAIYPELEQDATNPRHASLDLEVCPATPIDITFKPTFTLDSVQSLSISNNQPNFPPTDERQNTAEPEYRSHKFSHLPTLHIDIELPVGYPDEAAPVVRLNTAHDWLPVETIHNLKGQVKELWEEYGHAQVLYAYIDYLQMAIEASFSLPSSSLTLSTSVEQPLLHYQSHALQAKFEAQTYDCGVCLYPKKGSSCHAMRGCGHVFCTECLQDFYNNAITEGSVETVQCLDPSCGKEAKLRPKPVHPTELLEVGISKEQVQRYVNLKLKKKMETDKTIFYCPRAWCQGPARSTKYDKYNTADLEHWPEDDSEDETEKVPPDIANGDANGANGTAKNTNVANQRNVYLGDRLRICAHCTYAFCHVCSKSWHGDYVSCLPAASAGIGEDDKASLDFIRLNTSPCPYCQVPTQKRLGCNHMICGQCMTHFCYLCSSWLDGSNPYKHFNTKGTGCYMRLWELEEGDEGQNVGAVFGGVRAAEQMAGELAAEMGMNDAGDDVVNREGLRRFVEWAANDEEDGWDSDELDAAPPLRRR